MILLQRYLASFLQHPYDAYYDYRRTGYPVLPINPSTNMNTEKNKDSYKWNVQEAEFSYNPDSQRSCSASVQWFGRCEQVNVDSPVNITLLKTRGCVIYGKF